MAKGFRSAIDAFNHMLDLYEAQPNRKLGILAQPDYSAMDAADEDAFHDAATGAANAGAIRLEMRRPPDEHLIKSLRLEHPGKLYRWVSRTPSGSLAQAAWDQTVAGIATLPDWLDLEREAAIRAWSTHKTWRGLGVEQASRASRVVRLAIALVDGVTPGTCYRQFSAEHAQHSKALKRSEMAVSGILRDALGLPPPAPDEEPLAIFGIQAYPDPVYVRGPFSAGKPAVPLAAFETYAAITPPSAGTVAWVGRAPYVLTIENKASFNAYVHGITDKGAVIFTGGFPSSAAMTLLRCIADGAPDVPWYHWGDVDGGGLRIFRFIEMNICRPAGIALLPHLMSPELAASLGQPLRSRALGIKAIAESDSAIAATARWLVSPAGRTLEQEMVRPSPPGGAHGSRAARDLEDPSQGNPAITEAAQT